MTNKSQDSTAVKRNSPEQPEHPQAVLGYQPVTDKGDGK
jgi:hypothetical protein